MAVARMLAEEEIKSTGKMIPELTTSKAEEARA